jgi:hypothetical protein
MLITSWFILVLNAGKVSGSELFRRLDFSFAIGSAKMRFKGAEAIIVLE